MFDSAGDGCGSCGDGIVYTGRPSWLRLFFWLVIAYCVLAFWCWDEVRFRRSGIELLANIEWVRTGPKGRGLQVRYNFTDPETQQRRLNTVVIPKDKRPEDAAAAIQFIPGELARSRLAVQARPYLVTVFFVINGIMAAACIAMVGYFAWEANRKILTPQQRAMLEYRKRQARAAE